MPQNQAAAGPDPLPEQLPAKIHEGVQKIEAVLEQIPQTMRRATLEMVFTETRIEAHRGPLPQPEVLRGYGEVLPGLPDRIVRMVEGQSNHRISQESKLVDARIRQTERAQIMTFVSILVILIIVAILGALGAHWLAGVLATTTIGSVVGAFLVRTASRSSKKPKDAEPAEDADHRPAPPPAPKAPKKLKKAGQG